MSSSKWATHPDRVSGYSNVPSTMAKRTNRGNISRTLSGLLTAHYFCNLVPFNCLILNSDCIDLFGEETIRPITRDDSVTCETQFSKVVPLEDGEVRDCIIILGLATNCCLFRSWSRY